MQGSLPCSCPGTSCPSSSRSSQCPCHTWVVCLTVLFAQSVKDNDTDKQKHKYKDKHSYQSSVSQLQFTEQTPWQPSHSFTFKYGFEVNNRCCDRLYAWSTTHFFPHFDAITIKGFQKDFYNVFENSECSKQIQPRGYKSYLVDAVVSIPAEIRVISSVTVDLSAVALLNILWEDNF